MSMAPIITATLSRNRPKVAMSAEIAIITK
jgi:hypothetical protein